MSSPLSKTINTFAAGVYIWMSINYYDIRAHEIRFAHWEKTGESGTNAKIPLMLVPRSLFWPIDYVRWRTGKSERF